MLSIAPLLRLREGLDRVCASRTASPHWFRTVAGGFGYVYSTGSILRALQCGLDLGRDGMFGSII